MHALAKHREVEEEKIIFLSFLCYGHNYLIARLLVYFRLYPLFQDGGSIILNASIAASKGVEASSVYNATKAAIRSFARTWTVELKQRKIRVNAISPGMINTPGLNGLAKSKEQLEQFKTSFVSTIPMGRTGSPSEVAKAASFLASDDSSYVTGIELFVDGGVAQI